MRPATITGSSRRVPRRSRRRVAAVRRRGSGGVVDGGRWWRIDRCVAELLLRLADDDQEAETMHQAIRSKTPAATWSCLCLCIAACQGSDRA